MIGPTSCIAGLVCIYLFVSKRKGLENLVQERFPELGEIDLASLRRDLACAYGRLFLLGVAFMLLGGFYLFGRPPETRMFYLLLIGGLALANIPPRFRVMRRLAVVGLSPEMLRRRGVVL